MSDCAAYDTIPPAQEQHSTSDDDTAEHYI